MSPHYLVVIAVGITWIILLVALYKFFKFCKQFLELKNTLESDLLGLVSQLKKLQAEVTEFTLEQQRTNRLTIEMLEVQKSGMIAEIIEETINAADVNKRTVICKSHYSTFHYIVYIQVFPDFCNQLILFFIQEQLVREYCSVSSLVNSGNSDFHSLSYEFFCIFNVVIRKL